MSIPRFRFGGYMNATGGGTNRAASSSYGSRPTSNNNREIYRSTGPSEAKTKSQERLSGTIRDTKAEAEVNEGSYLDTKMPGGNITYREMNEGRSRTAYEASLAKQEEMRKSIALAYNVNKDDGSGRSTIDQSTSNFQNLDNDQKQQLIDSGFAAAESSGVLGGTMGAELVTNQLKKQLAEATTDEEANVILGKLQQLGFSNVTQYDPFNTGATAYDPDNLYNAALGYDPSAVYSFSSDIDRYKGGTYLKDAFYDMQNKNLTPKEYTNYMNKISAFGHSPQTGSGFGGGGGGGYGYGSGGGGGGGGGYYYGTGGGSPQTYQRGQVGPGNLQEQVNQAFLSGGKPFAKGGIVSLVEA